MLGHEIKTLATRANMEPLKVSTDILLAGVPDLGFLESEAHVVLAQGGRF